MMKHHQLYFISNFRRVLNVVCFLLGDSPASESYVPTFRNTLFPLHRWCKHRTPSMKMEQCSETSAHKIQTPGNRPKEIIQQSVVSSTKITVFKEIHVRPLGKYGLQRSSKRNVGVLVGHRRCQKFGNKQKASRFKIQPPLQWIKRVKRKKREANDSLSPNVKRKMNGAVPLLPVYASANLEVSRIPVACDCPCTNNTPIQYIARTYV